MASPFGSMDYSFAMEYTGPPVNYEIPRAVPVDADCIPVAAVISTASMSNNFTPPVIQPVVKTDPLVKKLGVQEVVSPVSVTRSDEFDSDHVGSFSRRRSHCPSFRVVNVIDHSGELGFSDSDECLARVYRNGSSGSLRFSDSPDDSHDFSSSSDINGLVNDREHDAAMEIMACEGEEEHVNEAISSRNRMHNVAFLDHERSDEDNDKGELIIGQKSKVAKSNVKKGLCYRCLKGNRFTEKEVCIVCSAKYCSNCVLKAMGSMPEGRKCISCIGCRIDESKRANLGKSSRMLKRLLTDSRAKLIMNNEISCKANQLPPELMLVNGKPLSHEELVRLLGCPNPPRKVKPGKYWYDKVSGLWGKEGQRPCQIVSPELAVGGPIMQNASNGNTNVMVNNREITKPELWMMQLAGIHCEGHPNFWLSADGSFQEEGQNNVMERVWFKPGVKLVCAALSLPIVTDSAKYAAQEVNKVSDKVVGNDGDLEQKTPYKILLLGYDQSETSTIYKQARFLYNVPFSEDERQDVKYMIQSNLYCYIAILLEARERFEEESSNDMRMKSSNQHCPLGGQNSDRICETNIYSISPRLKAFSDWLLQITISGNLDIFIPAVIREYAPLVEELWKDRAFQATYNRIHEIQMLPRVSEYFLDRAFDISQTHYEPSDMDILYAEGTTSSSGVASLEFSFPESKKDRFIYPDDQNELLERYQLIRVHSSSLGENCKWLQMFEDVDLVIFCASLTDYDQFSYDAKNGVSTNKMLETKKLFETIVTHSAFAEKPFLLIFTRFNQLEEKIEQVPLTQCEWFHDYNPVLNVDENGSNNVKRNSKLAQRSFHYIADKYKRLFNSLTGNKLYVSRVTCFDADNVDEVLKYGREVLRWDIEKPYLCVNDWSLGSIDATTTS